MEYHPSLPQKKKKISKINGIPTYKYTIQFKQAQQEKMKTSHEGFQK